MADALVIFKPDSAHRLAARAGMWTWLSSEREWKLEGLTWHRPTTELIEQHYDFLRGRPFFPWLVQFMSALPVLVGRIAAEPAALERMRYELGETRIPESRPGSLRERFGIGGGVNVLHLSDSPESGEKEVGLWTGQVSLDRVDATIDVGGGHPDHTFHLRELAAQHAQKLLAEETDLVGDDFEALTRVILGAFA